GGSDDSAASPAFTQRFGSYEIMIDMSTDHAVVLRAWADFDCKLHRQAQRVTVSCERVPSLANQRIIAQVRVRFRTRNGGTHNPLNPHTDSPCRHLKKLFVCCVHGCTCLR